MLDLTENKACVLFSGGSDSSFVAHTISKEYREVHLLTFRQFGLVGIERSELSFRLLDRKVPAKFIHRVIDTSQIFRTLCYHDYVRHLFRHGTLTIITTCGACQFSFYVRVILYCIEVGITDIYDGANTGHDLSPMHIREVNKEIANLCERCDLSHRSRLFEEHSSKRSDAELFWLGLREKNNMKGDDREHWRYQPGCHFSHAVGYYRLWKSRTPGYREKAQRDIIRFYRTEMDYLRSLIDRSIEERI